MIPVLCGTSPPGGRVLIATRPVDFRRGADGLAAMVQAVLRQDPFLCVGRDMWRRGCAACNSAVMLTFAAT